MWLFEAQKLEPGLFLGGGGVITISSFTSSFCEDDVVI